MDTPTIDQAYAQLQSEFQDVARSVHTLAAKLNAAAGTGNTDAPEWLLDLKQIALDVKDEQVQVNLLLQALHAYIDTTNQQIQQRQANQQMQSAPQNFALVYQQGGYQQQYRGGRRGGMLGGLLGGTFGQAIEMGAGIGLGEDLINRIF